MTHTTGRPPFKCKVLNIRGEKLEFYSRDALECIRSIYGDLQFAQDLVFAPERHYTSCERTSCLYNEMYTCDWWWTVQVRKLQLCLNEIVTDKLCQTILKSHQPEAMIVPFIVSSDKTLLTLFRGKTAYPIYMTIGNILKDIGRKPSHQAQLLIGYIPTTKLEVNLNKTACCHALANLFHACMHAVLGLISSYDETGVPMMSGDSIWH